MDLLGIVRLLWRYRLLTLPVVLLTIGGMLYTVAIKKPVYEAQASYILINPPAPPTADQVARNPELGEVSTDNPYTRFASQTVVVEILARTIGGDAARLALVNQGADPRYHVTPSSEYGSSSPIVQITGVGATPDGAIRTAELVSTAVLAELNRMQHARGVDKGYRISALEVDAAERAQLRVSGQLRTAIGVFGLGVVVLFIVVSICDAIETRARERVALAEFEPLDLDPRDDQQDELWLRDVGPDGGRVAAQGERQRASPRAPHR